jgi:shikimate kinase
VEPIIFVLGPSGVGKSYVSKALKEDYSFLHFDIDKKFGFSKNGFPAEWDEDIGKINFAILESVVRSRLAAEQLAGAILSFPTAHVFSPQQLEDASLVGISTVVLWGTLERCLAVRRVLQTKRIGRFNERDLKRYLQKNRRTFETYIRPKYAHVRVEAFQPDGSRWPRKDLLALILGRLTNDGLKRTVAKDDNPAKAYVIIYGEKK